MAETVARYYEHSMERRISMERTIKIRPLSYEELVSIAKKHGWSDSRCSYNGAVAYCVGRCGGIDDEIFEQLQRLAVEGYISYF